VEREIAYWKRAAGLKRIQAKDSRDRINADLMEEQAWRLLDLLNQ
jgi:hypothetical protein